MGQDIYSLVSKGVCPCGGVLLKAITFVLWNVVYICLCAFCGPPFLFKLFLHLLLDVMDVLYYVQGRSVG